MKKYIILGIFLATLTGCAGPWEKPGSSSEDFQRDLYGCRRDAAAVQDPNYMGYMIRQCLKVKGWREQ
jgi:hypothetical protein